MLESHLFNTLENICLQFIFNSFQFSSSCSLHNATLKVYFVTSQTLVTDNGWGDDDHFARAAPGNFLRKERNTLYLPGLGCLECFAEDAGDYNLILLSRLIIVN